MENSDILSNKNDFLSYQDKDQQIIRQLGKVAVLMGGDSHERKISLISGQAVLQALQKAGVDAHAIDWDHNGRRQLIAGNFDRAFIVLHGRLGEDGCVQGFLETLQIPYTGSGVAASALCMDKVKIKHFFAGVKIPTPRFIVLSEKFNAEEIIREFGLPLCVKPALEGSSLGISKVDKAEDLKTAWKKAAQYNCEVLVEPWLVDAEEYTVGFLNGLSLPVIKIEVPQGFYDYHAKYLSQDNKYLCPCGLSEYDINKVTAIAKQAFNLVGCRDWGRVDLLRDRNGDFHVLEVNTVPGMTPTSLVPKAAQNLGISFTDLVLQILWNASLERNQSTMEFGTAYS